jgi:O-antigen/teichoic acid export membrane protein
MTRDRLPTQLLWAVAGQAFLAAGTLGALKLAAFFSGPSGYGIYAIGLTVSGTMTMLVFGPLGQLVIRYFAASSEGAHQVEFLRYVTSAYLRLGAASLAIVTLGALVLATGGQANYAAIALLGGVHGLTAGSILLLVSAANSAGHQATVALAAMLDQSLRILALGLVVLAGNGEAGALLLASTCGASAVALLLLCGAMRRWFPASNSQRAAGGPTASPEKNFSAYLRPFFAFVLFAAAGTYGDRYILQIYCGEECVGIFSAAYSIANGLIVAMSNMALQLIVPVVFAGAGSDSGRRATWLRNAGLAFGAGIVACVGLSLAFGDALVSLLASDRFAQSARILPLVLVGYGIFHFGQLFTVRGLIVEDSRRYILPKAIHAIVLVGLGIVCVPRFGVSGMAWALIAAAAIYLALIVAVNRVR